MPELLVGDSMDRLLAAKGDVGVLRPYIGHDGGSWIDRLETNGRGELVENSYAANTAASLTYDAWKEIDKTVERTLYDELTAVADLRRRGLIYNLSSGMAHTVLQYQTMGDITRATVSMSPTRRSEVDRPEFDTAFFPLPLVHKDFDLDARELLASRAGMMALDTTNAELAARKVAEELEDMTIGTVPPFKYAGNYVYGYLTFPQRAVKNDMTPPTGSNGPTVLADIVALRQQLIDDNHKGPFVLYVNRQWSEYLDLDFSTAKGQNTLRQRILALPDIQEVKTLDRLPTTGWHVVLVEMQQRNVRVVNGMEPTTVQWESQGGYMRHYKVITMQAVQLRPDPAGNSGIGHGYAA